MTEVQATKHVADDKNEKYQVVLEGEVEGFATTKTSVKIIMTAGDESLLKNFPRPKIFEFDINKSSQTTL